MTCVKMIFLLRPENLMDLHSNETWSLQYWVRFLEIVILMEIEIHHPEVSLISCVTVDSEGLGEKECLIGETDFASAL